MKYAVGYLLIYLNIFLCPLFVFVVCGLCTAFCRRSVNKLLNKAVGLNAVSFTSFIGTPVHEFGHVLMCLLFGHKVTKVQWFSMKKNSPTLGSVSHSYNPKNPYNLLGLVFIGLGPIFSGLAYILIVLRLCFPEALSGYISAAKAADLQAPMESFASLGRSILSVFSDDTMPLWARILGFVLIAFVCLHLELSVSDIKSSLKGLPVLAVIVLVITLVLALADMTFFPGASAALCGHINRFTVFVFSVFMLVIFFSLALLVCSTLIYLISSALKHIFGKH